MRVTINQLITDMFIILVILNIADEKYASKLNKYAFDYTYIS